MAMKTVGGPIKRGHVPFGSDLARCAIVYDLCHEHWTPKQRTAFHEYMNRTVDANVQSETHVFHNAWYGYKNWGIGLACYATFHENPRAVEILRTLERDYLTRAAPALELAGAGGHYDGFGTTHDVNYHLRSIAHNTILVHDPAERWPGIRGGPVTGNDGGQSHAWPHHNGAVSDPAAWHKDRSLYETGKILAFEDSGDYVYIAGDATGAYSPKKLKCFTRQIVYVRPDTFIVFDRVVSRRPELKKSWLLQAMSRPDGTAPNLTITNGKARLSVQTVLPRDPQLRLADGPELYAYDGRTYLPGRDTGPAPVCRIMISPSRPAKVDYFLHVLTTKDATSNDPVSKAVVRETDSEIQLTAGKAVVAFGKHEVGGYMGRSGPRRRLPEPDSSDGS